VGVQGRYRVLEAERELEWPEPVRVLVVSPAAYDRGPFADLARTRRRQPKGHLDGHPHTELSVTDDEEPPVARIMADGMASLGARHLHRKPESQPLMFPPIGHAPDDSRPRSGRAKPSIPKPTFPYIMKSARTGAGPTDTWRLRLGQLFVALTSAWSSRLVRYDGALVPDHTEQPDPSERLARRWVSEGRMTRELAQAALQRRSVTGQRFEEALMDVGVREDQLLKLLAETYRCQYITTQKLAAARVNAAVLAMVPKRIAEQRLVVPVLFDRPSSTLSVVMATPDDGETLEQLRLATQVKCVKPLVARPSAVKAAVSKFYDGDDFAFAILQNERMDVDTSLDRGMLPPGLGSAAPRTLEPVGALGHPPGAARPRDPHAHHRGIAHRPRTPSPGAPRIELDDSPLLDTTASVSFVDAVDDLDSSPRNPAPFPGPSAAEKPRTRRPPGAPPPPRVQDPPRAPVTAPKALPLESVGDPFQLAVVLVSLLEGNRKNLRGHSIQTARLVRSMCDEFGVPREGARAAEVAALIHDVGKASGSYHLTAYNVAHFDGHRTAARKLYKTPERVLESAKLNEATVRAVHHMYERYDGDGFPDSLRENDIPLESRILALCDSYTDLTTNPRNSFRKVLSAQEACEALKAMQGSVFDPKVVARFTRSVLGADLAQQLRSDRGVILLVDPDVENTTMLELALQEKLYDVHVTRSEEEALQYLEGSTGVDVVISENDLPDGSGLNLLTQVRKRASADASMFVFLAADNDSSLVARALEAGAADYLIKPVESQIVVTKVRYLLERNKRTKEGPSERGVSGSLEEMALPDIVQVLHQGRKSAGLRVMGDGHTGTVFFEDGVIVDCSFKEHRGDLAFYELVGLSKGSFTIDPKAKSDQHTIQMSAEMLLLEGMRRLDEASR
jgi:response regulator RpfG family c-di-GMP phosphodiesterase